MASLARLYNRSRLDLPRRITLFLLSRVVRLLFGLKLEGKEDLACLDRPPLVLGNHLANWDPIWVIAVFEERVRFLASDLVFRRPVLGRLLRWAGMISKRKFYADPRAVRELYESVRRGDWVGFYPEGEASWHGGLAPLVSGTGKLVKALGAPIVCVVSEGAYFSQGRWLSSKAFKPVKLKITDVISSEDLKNLNPEETEQRLRKALMVDPWNSREAKAARFEGIEAALVYCPACGAFHKLQGRHTGICCQECGSRVRIDRAPAESTKLQWTLGAKPGSLEQGPDPLPSSIREWFQLQDQAFVDKGYEVWAGQHFEIRFEEHSPRRGRIFSMKAQVSWPGKGKIRIVSIGGKVEYLWEFPIEKLQGVNVQMGERLEFREGKKIFILRFKKPRGGYPFYRWFSLQGKAQDLAG